ncbi:MAG: outer membrane beta-barrel protein [Saprospiraceae bacterium]
MNKKSYNVTDKGWKAMSEILDQEMPVERPRRRVLVFWLLFWLLPLAAVIAWFMTGQVPGTRFKDLPVSTPERPIARQPVEQSHPSVTISTPPVSEKNYSDRTGGTRNEATNQRHTTEPATTIKANSTTVANAATIQPGLAQKQIGTTAVTHKTAANSNTNKAEKITGTTPVTAPAAPATTAPDLLATNPVAIAVTANVPADPTPEAPQIETASPTTSALAEKPAPTATPPVMPTAEPIAQVMPTPAPPIDPVRQKTKALRFGASAGAFSNMSARFGGVTAGFAADWQASDRWGLRSGLAYQYHALNENEQPLTTVTTGTYAEATGDNTIFDTSSIPVNSNDLTTPVYVAVSSLHRIEMPMLAYWQPWTKLRVYGGPSVGYTVYSEVADLSYKNNKTFKIQSGTPAGNLSSRVSDQTSGFDFRWNLGTSFRVGKNLEMGVFYQSPVKVATNPNWLEQTDNQMTPAPSPDIQVLAKERQSAAIGRSVLQFMATVFF